MAHAEVTRPRTAARPVPRPVQRPRASSRWRYEEVLVGAVSLALALAVIWLIWQLARPIGLLLAAVIVANALEPVADYLMRWMRRTFAIVVIYTTLFLVAGIAVALVIPSITRQADTFAQDVPALIQRAQALVEQWGPAASTVANSAAQSLMGSGGALAAVPLQLASAVLEGVLVLFLSLYWLVAMPTIRGFLLSLVRPDQVADSRSVLHEIGQTMGGYVRGVLIEAAIIGILVFAGMWLIGVRYAAILATLAAFGEVIPYIGPIVAAIPGVILALYESPTQGLIVLGFYLGLQLLESYVLFPLVVGSQSEIPPLLIIVGLLAGGTIGGVLGALVAVPLAGALRVVVVRLVAPAIRCRTGGASQLAESESGD